MASSPSYIHMTSTGSNVDGGGGGIAFDTSATNTDETKFIATIAGIRNTEGNGSNDLIFSTTKMGVNSGAPTEKLRIDSSGAFGLGGATYGTSGQVLSSQGSGSAVQWATPGLIYEGNLTSLPTDAGSVNVDVILDACKRIEIFIFSYSVNSSSGEFVLRLRTGSGTITSNYKGSGHYLSNTSYAGATANSDGFKSYGLGDSSSNYTGHIVVKNVHSNIWFCNGDFWNDASSTGYWMSGHVDAGAALAGVQLRNNSGSFDAGTYKIIQYNTI